MHEIALPIADTATLLDNGRPFADMTLVRLPEMPSYAVWHAWAALEAQIRLVALPASVNPVVYRLVAQRAQIGAGALHVAGDLLRREGILQHLLDVHFELQITIDHAILFLRRLPPAQHRSVGMPLKVHAAGIRVSLQLATDRGSMLAKNVRNLRARLMAKVQSTNDFALCKRQMRIFVFQTSYVLEVWTKGACSPMAPMKS